MKDSSLLKLKMLKRKIKVLSLSDKHKIINAFKSGKSRNEIISEFDLPESTFYKIIKSKDSIESQCSKGHGNVKRSRPSKFCNIEKRLLDWIKQTLDENIPIDGPLLKEKSKDFAKELRIQNFTASNGWLERFKKRHHIAFRKAAGESISVDESKYNDSSLPSTSFLHNYTTEEEDTKDSQLAVSCSFCNMKIVGNRYTCLQCIGVDLCISCEAAEFHPQHVVIRLPSFMLHEAVLSCMEPARKALADTDLAKPPPKPSRRISKEPLEYVLSKPSKPYLRPRSKGTKRLKNQGTVDRNRRKISKDDTGDNEKSTKVVETGSTEDCSVSRVKVEVCLEDAENPSPEGPQSIEVNYPEQIFINVKQEESATNESTYIKNGEETKVKIKIEDDFTAEEEVFI